MKSLYESILGSTKSGKERIAEKVKQWFMSCDDFIAKSKYKIKPEDITLEPYKDMWKIFITSSLHIRDFYFSKTDCGGSSIMPYKIHSIQVNGVPVNIGYMNLEFENGNDYAQEVGSVIIFSGCRIKKLDKPPKNCNTIRFRFRHSLGGGTSTIVDEISNINVDWFSTFDLEMTSLMGLSCRLDRIKGITVNRKFEICESMLGYYALEKGKRKFKEDASQLLSEFFKNNNVDVKKCEFKTEDKKIGKIKFDKETNRWVFSGHRI